MRRHICDTEEHLTSEQFIQGGVYVVQVSIGTCSIKSLRHDAEIGS